MSRQQAELHMRQDCEQQQSWQLSDAAYHSALHELESYEMKIGQMMDGKFLKKEDVDPAKLVTIKGLAKQNAGRDDNPEMKWTMSFQELSKPLVMNGTNLQLCAHALGTDETDNWIGKQIVLYNDPSVQFQGKLVGGVRIRAAKKKVVSAPVAPVQAPVVDDEELDDEIPFS